MSDWAGFGAAESAEGIAPIEVADLLASLVEKSLAVLDETTHRFRLLESIRAYGRANLAEGGQTDAMRARHLAHFLTLAEEAEPHLTAADQQTWLDRLGAEHDNLRAALEWRSETGTAPEAGLRLAGSLWRFWYGRGYFAEGRSWLAGFLEAGDGRSAARAKGLTGAGVLAFHQGDCLAARALHEESLAIGRELGDRLGIAVSLNILGFVAGEQGDYPAARALHEESLALRRELGDRGGIAVSLNNLGIVAFQQADYPAAWALYEESLAINRELGHRGNIAAALSNLGNVVYRQGDYPAARALLEESLAIRRELGDRWGIANSSDSLGLVALEQGDYPAARALLEESLAIFRELGDRVGIAYPLEGLALALAALEIPDRAARLWGYAERLREESGSQLSPDERRRHERQVSAARSAVDGDSAFDAAWQEGRAMTLEQAMEIALQETEE